MIGIDNYILLLAAAVKMFSVGGTQFSVIFGSALTFWLEHFMLIEAAIAIVSRDAREYSLY